MNNVGYYSLYRLVITRNGGNDAITLSELQFFGTPGPTTLDKGSLTLGRSLDVPRISRYDVDTETPRPEKLVLDFDTTVNSSPTDISGSGNHAAFFGDAYYSAADKAFKFDGTGDTVYVDRNGSLPDTNLPTGDAFYTISCWIKSGTTQTNTDPVVFYFGSSWAASQTGGIYLKDGNKVAHDIGAVAMHTTNAVINVEQWHHVAVVKRGTGSSSATTAYNGIFIDGVEITALTMEGSARTQAIQGVDNISIGSNFNGAPGSFGEGYNGCVSKPQIWNVALEPSEVQKLYRLGRTGRSMVISDTAVGIGKVPEAQLDVRGAVRFDRFTDKLRIDSPAGYQLSIGRSDAYLNEFRWYAWGSGCNWYTPYTGQSIYIGRDGQTLSEFNFYSVTTVKKGGTTLHSSDDRLKRDEAFITNATDTLLKLKPQTYIKKHRLPENENDTDIPEQFEAGLIAQDVWYDAPELRFLVHPSKDANPSETKPVSPDPNDPTQDPDYSSWGTTQAYVNYEGFLPYLIKSNQEIYNELQAEKAKNLSKRQEHLVNDNIAMKSKITSLERKTTDQELELIKLKRRLNKLERPA
jgi:hypothetical protein